MQKIVHRAADRGIKDIGWLLSKFSFSFSSYHNPAKNSFGLLKTFNDDRVSVGGGFGLHAHVNMEIISVMLQGKMNHKDSMGYTEVVERDWVQIMSAGTGLRHEEYNVGDEDVRFLQIWIEPKQQNILPRYQKRYFNPEQRKNRLQTIVSNEEGQAHCWINQNAKINLISMDDGQSITYKLNPVNKCLYIFCLKGSVHIAGEHLPDRDAIGLWNTDSVDISAGEECECIIIEVPVNQ